MTHFIAILTLLQWSGPTLVNSLRYACITLVFFMDLLYQRTYFALSLLDTLQKPVYLRKAFIKQLLNSQQCAKSCAGSRGRELGTDGKIENRFKRQPLPSV